MINESDLNISELMNYGINYGECIPVNIHEMSLLFDNKKDRIAYYKVIERIGQNLIDNYCIPRSAVEEFIKYGKIFSYESDDNKKRFYLDYHKLIQHVLLYFTEYNEENLQETVDILSNCNVEEASAAAMKKLKEIRKELDSVTSSKELEEFINKHQGVSRDVLFKLGLIKDINDNEVYELHKYIELIKEDIRIIITRVIVNNKHLLKEVILNSSINEKVFENVNKEKFLFYLAAATLNKAAQFESIDPCVYFAINYYMQKTEEPSLNNITISMGHDKYDFLKFSKQLMDYISKHPKVGMPKFKENTFSDCTPNETRDYLLELSKETLENFDIVETNEVYIKNSENTGIKRTSTGNKTKRRPKTDEISKLGLQKRKFYSDNEDKIYVTLMGKNKFDGYLAHIFVNGKVIFEKYDKDNQNLSNEAGAAYIMTIKNFNEFSKKSISELRDYVKENPDGDISYKCHAGKWMNALQEVIDMPTNISMSEIDRVLIKYKYKVNTK